MTTKSFDPYSESVGLGAVDHESGINWSHASFDNQAARDNFVKRCKENGFRTRQVIEFEREGKKLFNAQYHHYAD